MSTSENKAVLRLVIAALYVAATLLLPAAHATGASGSSALELAAYALPDGTIPALCSSKSKSDRPGGSAKPCPACLVQSGQVPGPVAAEFRIAAGQSGTRINWQSAGESPVACRPSGAASPRGPPERSHLGPA